MEIDMLELIKNAKRLSFKLNGESFSPDNDWQKNFEQMFRFPGLRLKKFTAVADMCMKYCPHVKSSLVYIV